MALFNILWLALFTALFVAAHQSTDKWLYEVKESIQVPSSWKLSGRAPPAERIQLTIGLERPRFHELTKYLHEISDPDHERFRDYLTFEQVNELSAPAAEAVDGVLDWLTAHGINGTMLSYSPARDWITCEISVHEAEKLLDTEYRVYVHDAGARVLRTEKWSAPRHLHDYISTIQPTTSFLLSPFSKDLVRLSQGSHTLPKKGEKSTQKRSTLCEIADVCDPDGATPRCTRTLYGTLNYTAHNLTSVGFVSFDGDFSLRFDVAAMLPKYRPEAEAGADFQEISINNGSLRQTPLNSTERDNEVGIEGAIDAQSIIPIAWPLNVTRYSTGRQGPVSGNYTYPYENEPLIAALEYLLHLPDNLLPSVISSSYGGPEASLPRAYAESACGSIAQLAARGTTFVASSGDEGVSSDNPCPAKKGQEALEFSPNFPATCPFVLTVGGTQYFDPEVALNAPAPWGTAKSGGGFSLYFPQPSYQSSAVQTYLSLPAVSAKAANYSSLGLFNLFGRAYPDISAIAYNTTLIYGGEPTLGHGTSVSAPTVAGVLGLVNDALLASGKGTLGWMNPWLYRYGQAGFQDILVGDNNACEGVGWPVAEGWDVVSGFGTPRFGEILRVLGVAGMCLDC